MGLEPTTPGATVQCSDRLSYARHFHIITSGAPGGIRTPDPLLRRQLLYPTELQALHCTPQPDSGICKMVGASGFEPPTPCSQGRCANRAALRPERQFNKPISDLWPLLLKRQRLFFQYPLPVFLCMTLTFSGVSGL